MSIAPFSFRDFTADASEIVPHVAAKSFLPHGRIKEEAPPPPPPPPSFNEEQLRAAERDSYQKGFLAGITEGKNQAENTQAQIDIALGEAVAGFEQRYAPLFSIYREMLKTQAAQLPELAYGIAKKVAGNALDENARAVIEEICLRCLQAVAHEPKLVITIHESLAPTLQKKLEDAARASQSGTEIAVVADPAIAPPNCRIEWKNGAMVRDTQALWQQVETVVNSMVASHTREIDTLCDAIQNTPVEGE